MARSRKVKVSANVATQDTKRRCDSTAVKTPEDVAPEQLWREMLAANP